MAKNKGAAFARLDPDQRKRFEQTGPTPPGADGVEELDFADDPRDADKMGRHNQPRSEERRQQEDAEVAEAGPGETPAEHLRREH
jgi:hypothetical protein